MSTGVPASAVVGHSAWLTCRAASRICLARGGKLVLWHGWADPGSTVWHTLNYWTKVRQFVGTTDSDKSMALYMVPGVYHCNGGPTGSAQDFQTQVMNWVETGAAPGWSTTLPMPPARC